MRDLLKLTDFLIFVKTFGKPLVVCHKDSSVDIGFHIIIKYGQVPFYILNVGYLLWYRASKTCKYLLIYFHKNNTTNFVTISRFIKKMKPLIYTN